MRRNVIEYHFCCPACGSDDLKCVQMVPTYTDVIWVSSDAQIGYGDESEKDFDGIEESYFVCGGCQQEPVIDGERISSLDPCTLLKWFREKNGTPQEEETEE